MFARLLTRLVGPGFSPAVTIHSKVGFSR